MATIGPVGAPQVHPVAFWVDKHNGTIDIGGPDLANSQKYRNIQADARVSLVVDDAAPHPVGPGGQRGRGLEIRAVSSKSCGAIDRCWKNSATTSFGYILVELWPGTSTGQGVTTEMSPLSAALDARSSA
ncbi:pyridoxamine 5'-phosphate oxidase family protein [Nocardia arthritidis]|uniref:Uncharacterized protein n=1 Tax=Nocardia arthritidis TaxID=228602 RepID=A0A6G9YIA9_9NOCA|nr:hypothetical protein F5544_25675 [Nocardia arthritidis]